MELRIKTSPQEGASYDDVLAVARRAEQLGFAGVVCADHYLKTRSRQPLPGPLDVWTTMAGLARDTSVIRLGSLVTSATFRFPGPLAISLAQIDQMSGGRVDLGIGTGWFAEEHAAYGIPFPDLGERFDRLTEQLEVITGLWYTPPGERFSFTGKHYVVTDSPGLPKPVQARVPLIIGGSGARRTPELAARFATEFNRAFVSIDEFTSSCDRVRRACERIGRDPASLTYSAAVTVCVGDDEKEFLRRVDTINRLTWGISGLPNRGSEGSVDPALLRSHGAGGTVDDVVATLARWRDAGAERLYLKIVDLTDLDQLDLIAEAVRPQLAV